MLNIAIAALALAIWAYLLVGRGGFWLGLQNDSRSAAAPARWPAVTAVIPARNEAEHVGETVASLLRQDYPGPLSVIVVDDNSTDGTAEAARHAVAGLAGAGRLEVVGGRPLPAGWTGKLWAVKQGIEAAEQSPVRPDYLLLTDADIVHEPDSLRWLVSFSQAGGQVLTSFMAKLRCESLAERIHIPAFIFFFEMLYPFAWVARRDKATAAAAGGCMLVHAQTLRQAGGIEIIRDALIDDCSLAAKMKTLGPIWLGLTERVRSIRPYDWQDTRRMVARSAYAQLRYSPLLLAGTTLGMLLIYVAPPALALFGGGAAQIMGALAWVLMAVAFQPTLRFYNLSPSWGVALPAIAFLYMLYTLDSAYQYARGRGGAWKGRVQANVAGRS
ncbi:MAG: glycosyltransferase [Variibacter sp.]|nr:glycosyltransferase [Variibacter sp.]